MRRVGAALHLPTTHGDRSLEDEVFRASQRSAAARDSGTSPLRRAPTSSGCHTALTGRRTVFLATEFFIISIRRMAWRRLLAHHGYAHLSAATSVARVSLSRGDIDFLAAVDGAGTVL